MNEPIWHVWVMSNNRHPQVLEFLSETDGVEEYLYPSVDREYKTKKGKSMTKTIPLYANYIFVKYIDDPYIQVELSKCQWLTTYVGICSYDELQQIKKMNGSDYEDLLSSVDDVYPGMVVKMNGEGFKDMTATVVEVDGDKIVVSIRIFGAERLVKCNIEDITR